MGKMCFLSFEHTEQFARVLNIGELLNKVSHIIEHTCICIYHYEMKKSNITLVHNICITRILVCVSSFLPSCLFLLLFFSIIISHEATICSRAQAPTITYISHVFLPHPKQCSPSRQFISSHLSACIFYAIIIFFSELSLISATSLKVSVSKCIGLIFVLILT